MNETAPLVHPTHDLSFLALFLQADPIVKGVMVALVVASLASWTVILDKLLRIRALRREARAFERAAQAGETVGATLPGAAGRIGAAAPFGGLFGTVWGIMISFSAIARSQDTSLSVVAPGIAEALFATAIGLAAAIPAVLAYNAFATALGRLQQAFSSGIARLGDRLACDGASPARHG